MQSKYNQEKPLYLKGEVSKNWYILKLSDKIGQGGFGTVYKGYDMERETLVAIKQVKQDELGSNTFKGTIGPGGLEFSVAKKLQGYPHVVQVYDYANLAGNTYLIQEFCEGGTLFSYLMSRPALTESLVLDILNEITQGLKAAHDLGFVHRDIKPPNILRKDGKWKICDFGIVTLFQSYTVAGTCGYMAPEVRKGCGYGKQADIYSLGRVFSDMLNVIGPTMENNNIKKLTTLMMKEDHNERPDTDKLIKHIANIKQRIILAKENDKMLREQYSKLKMT